MTSKTIAAAAVSGALMIGPAAMAQDPDKKLAEQKAKAYSHQYKAGHTDASSKVITGAPYEADEKSVTTQTLADGNRIVNVNAAKRYRDQQGRTRVERGEALDKTVVIDDPVLSKHFVLNQRKQSVSTSSEADHRFVLKTDAETAALHGPVTLFAVSGHHGGDKGKTENLGKQMMEGVSVEGTRTTVTIAAGQIGNERPIDIVSERWYSPDLQMVIMSKHSDPRMGETVFTVSNISRTNPDASLFQVPPAYTETQGTHRDVLKHVITREE